MYCEVPRFLRCCFCVPLRYGILTFGFMNLLICISVISYLSYVINTPSYYYDIDEVHLRIVFFGKHLAVSLCLFCIELIFNMVLIIGSLKKNSRLLKIFYYYGLTSTVATFLISCLQFYEAIQFRHTPFYAILGIAALNFLGLVLQVYLIILVKNEIIKLENNQRLRFTNHTAEAVIETAPADAIYRNTTVEMI